MAKNVRKIAEGLGATIGEPVADVGGGAFGMARLAAQLSARLEPIQGKRPGRPSDPSWVLSRKVRMSRATFARLVIVARRASTNQRKVSPMQVAAQLLEESLKRLG
ncbi:MAG: hypothetical protein R3C10_17355 [Pirellulales bacterium]